MTQLYLDVETGFAVPSLLNDDSADSCSQIQIEALRLHGSPLGGALGIRRASSNPPDIA